MAQYFQQPHNPPYGASPPNLQFFPSTYSPAPVSGHATPSQAAYGYGPQPGSSAYGSGGGFNSGFGGAAGVSGRMGEQGGLRTGWLAAFGTEGYDGEPPLLEELGVNFGHIQSKVKSLSRLCSCGQETTQLTKQLNRRWQCSTLSRVSTNTSWTTLTSQAPSSSSSSSAPSYSSPGRSTSDSSTGSPS
jgi:hypothetical protein